MDTTNVLNRRIALKRVAAAVVASPMPAVALVPAFASLVAAYDAAYATMEATGEVMDQKQDDYRIAAGKPFVPVRMGGDGSIKAAVEFPPHANPDEAVARIERAHARAMDDYRSDVIIGASPTLLAEAGASLDRSKAECMQALAEVVAKREAVRAEIGLDKAEADYDKANVLLDDATEAVLLHRPNGSAERAAKADWLLMLFKRQGDLLDERQVAALAQSIRGEA